MLLVLLMMRLVVLELRILLALLLVQRLPGILLMIRYAVCRSELGRICVGIYQLLLHHPSDLVEHKRLLLRDNHELLLVHGVFVRDKPLSFYHWGLLLFDGCVGAAYRVRCHSDRQGQHQRILTHVRVAQIVRQGGTLRRRGSLDGQVLERERRRNRNDRNR